MIRESRAWRRDAASAETPCDEWFPEPRSLINPLLLRICAECPVWRDCLLYALARPEIWHGVWAGLSAREIADLRDRLVARELGLEVVEVPRRLVQQRRKARYLAAVPRPVPGREQLREQGELVRSVMRTVGLFDDGLDRRGRAA